MSAAPLRVGWCPGALRPMDSGDGLIVRVKPHGSRLTLDQARGIAEAAQRFGNGALDLTSRANLQIRGVTGAGLPALTALLDRLGLLDPSPEAEAVRNVVASPLAGLDRTAAFDIGPAVAALEARLVDEVALHALPAKFGIVVDDGGLFGLGDVAGDIRFEARCDGVARSFAISSGEDTAEAVFCAADDLADAAEALMRRFIEARRADADLRHMADLDRRVVGGPLIRPLLTQGPPSPARGEGICSPSPLAGEGGPTQSGRMREPAAGNRSATRPVGLFDLSASHCALGVAAPFGRLGADQLLGLAAAARENHAGELRLTPWRAVLVPGLDRPAAARIAAASQAAGWITDPADPRLAVAACPGHPGCRRGTTPVLDHAAALATRIPRDARGREILLHVSGCGKGCAHRGEAAVTLVGQDGRYDLVLDGKAGDEPVWRGLTFEQAARRVEAWGRGEKRP